MAANKDDFTVKKISPKLGGERGTRKPYGPTSSHDLVEQMEFLYVEVIQAINYHNTIENPRGCPMVEVILGNYKSSTENLPIGPEMNWNQVFAFDKSKGDVLSVVLSVFIKVDQKIITKTLIGKRNFKLAADIPSRTPPDARIAPQWYFMKDPETGYHMDLLMSVWFGTQMDEVYSQAWFSDAYYVSASRVINTRPKLYIAPRLCYVRVTIVSGHDLLPTDGSRTPSVYVRATLGSGGFALKTVVSSGTNPSWNQDLIFVLSEPFEGTLYVEIMDRVDDQHEECIARLKKKLSEFATLKVPGSAPVLFHDLETPVKVEPAGDTRRFASRIKMKLAIDQAYHVTEEYIQYSSDFRAFAKGLWPGVVGKLEIGILGATGLKQKDEKKAGIDSYVVAKYGNRWARTRTVVNNTSPKWNEQYSWDVYDMSTVLTIGVYDNRQINNNDNANDTPIGKVRIPLNRVQWDWIYTGSFPIMVLGGSGMKKMGELQLAIRCVCVASWYGEKKAHLLLMYPKAHYKSPMSVYQIEELRAQAVEVNCKNLAKTEPPLRNEVVLDMLKPKSKSFSMRKAKMNYERLYKVGLKLVSPFAWLNAKIVETTEIKPKACAFVLCGFLLYGMWVILWLGWYAFALCLVYFIYWDIDKWVRMYWIKTPPPPPLIINDLKLWNLDFPNLDELEEEFDSFPTSLSSSFPKTLSEVSVLAMRYDRLRKLAAKLMLLMGDAASQGERFLAIFTLFKDMHLGARICLWFICFGCFHCVYYLWDVVCIERIIFLPLLDGGLTFHVFATICPLISRTPSEDCRPTKTSFEISFFLFCNQSLLVIMLLNHFSEGKKRSLVFIASV